MKYRLHSIFTILDLEKFLNYKKACFKIERKFLFVLFIVHYYLYH